MPSYAPNCPHCRSAQVVDVLGGSDYRCLQCALFFGHDGAPLVPEACQRCGGSITWRGEFYDCGSCGRVGYGPFPREPGSRLAVPQDGFLRHAPGVMAGADPSRAR